MTATASHGSSGGGDAIAAAMPALPLKVRHARGVGMQGQRVLHAMHAGCRLYRPQQTIDFIGQHVAEQLHAAPPGPGPRWHRDA